MFLKTEGHRIRMSEVDAARVIYYASPYLWREALFTGWLAEIGHPLSEMLETGTSTPCVASSARYLLPLRLDDVVTLQLRSGDVGRSSFGMGMDVVDQGGKLAVQVETTNVWVATTGGLMRAESIPEWFRSLLTRE